MAREEEERPASGEDVTTSQFRDEVHALAAGLIAAGIEAGDRVALMSHTRYEWTLLDFAIWRAGAVAGPDLRDLVGRAGRVDPLRLRARAIIAETDGRGGTIAEARVRRPGARAPVGLRPGAAERWSAAARTSPPRTDAAAGQATLGRLARSSTRRAPPAAPRAAG